MEEKRILLLSLGKGKIENLKDAKTQDLVYKGLDVYRKTTYQYIDGQAIEAINNMFKASLSFLMYSRYSSGIVKTI